MNAELRRMDDERITRLEERVENWMESTTEYRKSLCAKLDKVIDQLSKLPCGKGEEAYKALKNEVNLIQKIMTIFIPMIVGAIGGVYIILLPLGNTVDVNTKKWSVLEPEHKEILRSIEVLKEKAHYNGKAVV